MNVFCSSHTMKSFPLLVPLAEAGRPPSENSLDSNPRPPLALLAGGGQTACQQEAHKKNQACLWGAEP